MNSLSNSKGLSSVDYKISNNKTNKKLKSFSSDKF